MKFVCVLARGRGAWEREGGGGDEHECSCALLFFKINQESNQVWPNCACVERDALRDLCVSNSLWCSNNGWSEDENHCGGGNTATDYYNAPYKAVVCWPDGSGDKAGRVRYM